MINISLTQLEAVIHRVKYALLGYKDDRDITITVDIIQADPGNGIMVDCIQIKGYEPDIPADPAAAPITTQNIKQKSMVVEVFPISENQPPVASLIESFKIHSKY